MIVERASAQTKGLAWPLSTSSMYFLVIHSLEVRRMGAREERAEVG